MAQSSTLYNEPFRPQFHYSPPQSWMNDPNGLVYYEGEYHFFFQHNPNALVWGPMYWGHAVSSDLVHWETLPIALYPDEIGTIFSGTVVLDSANTSGLVPGGGLVAIYSYGNQSQGAAYSTDRGRTWQKYAQNPIMPALAKDFRDPKIFWHDAKQCWVMVLAAGQTILFFTSNNLLQWERVSEFTGGYIGGVWEMPDLFPLKSEGQTRWVLIVSVNSTAPAGGSGTRYFIGDFDGQTFVDAYPNETLWFDYGPDNYAGTTWNNAPNNARLFIGWLNNWLYANDIPTSTWRGATTIPRELSLCQTPTGLRLAQTPIPTLHQLRQPIATWEDLIIEGEVSLAGLHGRQLEMIAEFELDTAETFGFELYVDDSDATHLIYDSSAVQLIVNRPQSGIREFNPIFSAALQPHNNRICLHLFIDQSSVEIFADDGLLSITAQVFSEAKGDGVKLFAKRGTVRLVALQAYTLRSIWR